ncbi:MAG TPA: hypothetical protein VL361_27270 [Candidatus Limnocylindrales bacterium]|jgi:hypothetical protein|nr:hypothetical protein [Candidatus Limnocylindrales bacterium]
MTLEIQKVDTWAAPLEDTPGSLAGKLSALAKGGVNLKFVIARRAPDKPGTGVVFVTPIQGAAGHRAAQAAGFEKTDSLHTVQVEGPDKPGQGARVIQTLADGGLNLRGVSAAAIGKKFICYIALDNQEEAAKAVRLLRAL